MRHCCGSNDHPDSTLFIQMYRLVATYSLIKPPKGSNVTGDDMMQVLLNIKDIKNMNERRNQWDAQIDTILDKGRNCSALTDAAELMDEHNLFNCRTSEYVLAYVAGFVVRKCRRFTKFKEGKETVQCEDCLKTLVHDKNNECPDYFKLIDLKSKGFLSYPSPQLFKLVSELEKATLSVVHNNEVNSNTLFEIMDAVEKLAPLPMLGCETHQLFVTHNIIRFFLTTRMFFITKQSNKNESIAREKAKENRKLAKLEKDKKKKDKKKDIDGQEDVGTQVAPKKTKTQKINQKKTVKKVNKNIAKIKVVKIKKDKKKKDIVQQENDTEVAPKKPKKRKINEKKTTETRTKKAKNMANEVESGKVEKTILNNSITISRKRKKKDKPTTSSKKPRSKL